MSQTNFEILKELLEDNKDTEYGKKYNFSQINSIEDYKKQVPLSEFSDYQSYVDRMYKGEKNVLTVYPIVNYHISSGTTGPQKVIPISLKAFEKSENIAKKYVQSITIQKNEKEKSIFMGVIRIDLDKGIDKILLLSEAYFYSMYKSGLMDFNKYIDKDIIFDPETTDYYYEKVWCGVIEENIISFDSNFMYGNLQFFTYFEENYKEIISDIRNHRINPKMNISEKAKKFLLSMKFSEERLNFVEKECAKGFKAIAKRIWPNFRLVSGVSTKSLIFQNDSLDYFTGNADKDGVVFGMSEGLIGNPIGYNTYSYLLDPTSGFYEFMPYSDDEENNSNETLCLNEIKPGKKYEIILTNFSGFYRYRTGDIIEIVSNDSKGLIFEFFIRTNGKLNVTGEKTNSSHLEEVMKQMHTIIPNILDYKLGATIYNGIATYFLFLNLLDKNEVKIPLEEIIKKFDIWMGKANELYEMLRIIKALADPKVILLDTKEYNKLFQVDPKKKKHNKAQVLIQDPAMKEILKNLKNI